MRRLTIVLVLAAGVSGAGARQIEIDRTLQRVYGTAIMASDVRQARLLKLLPEAGDDDRSILTGLENRLLILRETARSTAADPEPAAIAARRRDWLATLPAGTDVAATMARTGMTDQALDAWFRDDLKMAAYLAQRFGPPGDAERARRLGPWLADLRRRANLTGK